MFDGLQMNLETFERKNQEFQEGCLKCNILYSFGQFVFSKLTNLNLIYFFPSQDELEKLESDIEKWFPDAPEEAIREGAVCAAQVDGLYHRVKVLGLKGSRNKVRITLFFVLLSKSVTILKDYRFFGGSMKGCRRHCHKN